MPQHPNWSADTNAQRAEDLEFMARHGETFTEAARRIGIKPASLEKWCTSTSHHDIAARLHANEDRPGYGARRGHVTKRIA